MSEHDESVSGGVKVERRVIYATVRDAIDRDGDDVLHIECRFSDGEKSAPISIYGGDEYEFLAHDISCFLNRRTSPSIDVEKLAEALPNMKGRVSTWKNIAAPLVGLVAMFAVVLLGPILIVVHLLKGCVICLLLNHRALI